MNKRENLKAQIARTRADIERLQQLEFDLCKKYLTLSDDKEWYAESVKKVRNHEDMRKYKTIYEGRYYWLQDFKDEGTGQMVQIERSRPIMQDGEWDEAAILTLVS